MFTLKNAVVLALAGSAVAAPWGGFFGHPGGFGPGGFGPDITSTVYDIATEVVTVTGVPPVETPTEAPAVPTPANTPADIPSAAPVPQVTEAPIPTEAPSPAAPSTFSTAWTWTIVAPKPTGFPVPAPQPAPAPAPAPKPSTPAAPAPVPSSAPATGYLDIANKWRQAGGLPQFSHSPQLEGNALKTAQDGNGQMIHELNTGSMAQVLAPGRSDDFEAVYVGGWLCELPLLPGLNGICAIDSKGWDHSSGETGHADILTSTAYSKIGCALADGIWACDLA